MSRLFLVAGADSLSATEEPESDYNIGHRSKDREPIIKTTLGANSINENSDKADNSENEINRDEDEIATALFDAASFAETFVAYVDFNEAEHNGDYEDTDGETLSEAGSL